MYLYKDKKKDIVILCVGTKECKNAAFNLNGTRTWNPNSFFLLRN